MKKMLTTQQVIDMAVMLYDVQLYTREEIRSFLNTIRKTSFWDASQETIEKVYDIVVG